MFYLDDFAVWTKTKAGSICRYIMCGIIVLIILIKIAFEWIDSYNIKNTIEANSKELAQLQYEEDQLLAKINEYETTDKTNSKNVKDIGSIVANLQTSYGSFKRDDEADVIATKSEKIGKKLQNYIRPGNNYNDWYLSKKGDYAWQVLNKQSYIIKPESEYLNAVFSCSDKNKKLLAITTAKLDLKSNMLYDVDNYTTVFGFMCQNKDTNLCESIYEPMSSTGEEGSFYSVYIKSGILDTSFVESEYYVPQDQQIDDSSSHEEYEFPSFDDDYEQETPDDNLSTSDSSGSILDSILQNE